MQRSISLKRQKSTQNGQKSGQAIMEYCLLVAFMVLIFGSVFSIIRRQLFYMWVCELYPRIASVRGCEDIDDCFKGIGDAANNNVKNICEGR